MSYPKFVKYVYVVWGIPNFSIDNMPYIIGIYDKEEHGLYCLAQAKNEKKWKWLEMKKKEMNTRLI